MNKRKMVVAGQFYSNNKIQLEHSFEVMNKNEKQEENIKNKKENMPKNIQVLIVPHAGYVYSGEVANKAYLSVKDYDFNTIVVIGPSHRIAFEGASICTSESYETPLGDIEIDLSLVKELLQEYSFTNFFKEVHEEHSTETQAPFIKHYFKNSKIIEIIYGKIETKQLEEIIKKVLEKEKILVVISTDLSHFYSLEEAKKLDNFCIEAIKEVDSELLNTGAQACGMCGLKASLDFAKTNFLKTKVLSYSTSAKVNKDEKRVVGYLSAIIGE